MFLINAGATSRVTLFADCGTSRLKSTFDLASSAFQAALGTFSHSLSRRTLHMVALRGSAGGTRRRFAVARTHSVLNSNSKSAKMKRQRTKGRSKVFCNYWIDTGSIQAAIFWTSRKLVVREIGH